MWCARLVHYEETDGRLRLVLEEMRWALRLIEKADRPLSVLCVVRDSEGRWLAGRRG